MCCKPSNPGTITFILTLTTPQQHWEQVMSMNWYEQIQQNNTDKGHQPPKSELKTHTLNAKERERKKSKVPQMIGQSTWTDADHYIHRHKGFSHVQHPRRKRLTSSESSWYPFVVGFFFWTIPFWRGGSAGNSCEQHIQILKKDLKIIPTQQFQRPTWNTYFIH